MVNTPMLLFMVFDFVHILISLYVFLLLYLFFYYGITRTLLPVAKAGFL